jgi:hypothetical protein
MARMVFPHGQDVIILQARRQATQNIASLARPCVDEGRAEVWVWRPLY